MSLESIGNFFSNFASPLIEVIQFINYNFILPLIILAYIFFFFFLQYLLIKLYIFLSKQGYKFFQQIIKFIQAKDLFHRFENILDPPDRKR